jgi:hypothetical protein
MKLLKFGAEIRFAINEMTVFQWNDDGKAYGELLGGGRIGFRQLAPLIAEYADLRVHRISSKIARR